MKFIAGLVLSMLTAGVELGVGTIALYQNNLGAARTDLQRALALAPDSAAARARLGAIAQRTGGPSDYRIAFATSEARIPLVAIDPLPTFRAKIDGTLLTLRIDTGGSGIDLSGAAVKRLHLATKAAGEGVFAGGLRAQVRSLRIDRFDVPGLTVRGISGGIVPGDTGDVDGIVGSNFLYHFLSTIDYAHRALVLRPRDKVAQDLIMFALVGDHFIFVRAHVNAAPDAWYNVDTGGPGIGVDLAQSALAAAGITPDTAHPRSMLGGGGAAQFLPFTAAAVTVGDLT